MRSSSLIAACLIAASVVYAVPAAAPAPSGTPCTYSCPAADLAGFELGRTTKPNGNLRCDYPGTPGVVGLYYCTYNASTGKLKTDKDDGFCPSMASQSCTATRRDVDGTYAAYKRHVAERAAAPAPAPRPQFMNNRAALGQRKLLERHAQ